MFGAPNFDKGVEKTPSYMDFELKLWPLESFLEIVAEEAWYSIVSERLGFVHAFPFRFVSFRSSSCSCSSSSLCVLSLLKAESDTEKKKEDREYVRAKMKNKRGDFAEKLRVKKIAVLTVTCKTKQKITLWLEL